MTTCGGEREDAEVYVPDHPCKTVSIHLVFSLPPPHVVIHVHHVVILRCITDNLQCYASNARISADFRAKVPTDYALSCGAWEDGQLGVYDSATAPAAELEHHN